MSGNHFIFTKVTHVTLTFDLVNPKSLGVLSSLRPIKMWHMKALKSKGFKIMIGNHLVYRRTDRHTDIPTDRLTGISKTICPLFFEGGHNKYIKHIII